MEAKNYSDILSEQHFAKIILRAARCVCWVCTHTFAYACLCCVCVCVCVGIYCIYLCYREAAWGLWRAPKIYSTFSWRPCVNGCMCVCVCGCKCVPVNRACRVVLCRLVSCVGKKLLHVGCCLQRFNALLAAGNSWLHVPFPVSTIPVPISRSIRARLFDIFYL